MAQIAVGMVAWQIWADEYGYGEDAYLMTEDDLREMAQAQIASIAEQGMSNAEFGITADMVAWAMA